MTTTAATLSADATAFLQAGEETNDSTLRLGFLATIGVAEPRNWRTLPRPQVPARESVTQQERRAFARLGWSASRLASAAAKVGYLGPVGCHNTKVDRWYVLWCAAQRRPGVRVRRRHTFKYAQLAITTDTGAPLAAEVRATVALRLRHALARDAFSPRVVTSPFGIVATHIPLDRADAIAGDVVAMLCPGR